MTPGKLDIVIYKGATFDDVLTWKDENGVAIDLTGYTARAQVRAAIGDAAPVLDMTTTNGKILLGGAAGTITFNVAATETELMAWTRGVWDLELVSGLVVTRLLRGTAKTVDEVTR